MCRFLLITFLFFCLDGKPVKAEDLFSPSYSSSKGYTSIVKFYEQYYATSTDGRIDCFSPNDEKKTVYQSDKEKLNCTFSNSEIILVGGEKGILLNSTDGKRFLPAKSGIEESINGFASKSSMILACCDNGTILQSSNGIDWKKIQTKAKGNIISISANNTFFIAVTDNGEILKSIDGSKWTIQNYNKEYAGYNKTTHFKKIFATQNNIMIIGIHDDGSPAILFSSLGNVWAERIPLYVDEHGMENLLSQKPNGIIYDPDRNQFVVACDDGVLISFPSCNKCNEFRKISEHDLLDLIYDDNNIIAVGSNYSYCKQNGF